MNNTRSISPEKSIDVFIACLDKLNIFIDFSGTYEKYYTCSGMINIRLSKSKNKVLELIFGFNYYIEYIYTQYYDNQTKTKTTEKGMFYLKNNTSHESQICIDTHVISLIKGVVE